MTRKGNPFREFFKYLFFFAYRLTPDKKLAYPRIQHVTLMNNILRGNDQAQMKAFFDDINRLVH